jgi:heme/copper-type cytochrome/quinol oxidase subunit 4
METNIIQNKDDKKQDEQIKAILFLLESHLQSQLEEVQQSNALMELGAKTDLIQEIEKDIENPFRNVLSVANSMNRTALALLHQVFKAFFLKNKDIIVSAFLVPQNALFLEYFLVLKDESEATWDRIHGYLAEFHQTDLSNVYGVRINVIDAEFRAMLPAERVTII